MGGKVLHETSIRSIESPGVPKKGEIIDIEGETYLIRDFDIFTDLILYSISLHNK